MYLQINQGYLQATDFIGSEVMVGTHWHIIMATDRQLELLKTARRWFMDGTFKITRKPFQQLWTIHTFIHKNEMMKQVPLVFVLMTNKSTDDYVAVSKFYKFYFIHMRHANC